MKLQIFFLSLAFIYTRIHGFGAGMCYHVPLRQRRVGNCGSPSTSRTSQLNLMFHRLSDDCMSALRTAQEQASLLHQTEVNNACLLLGIVDSPEHAKTTLETFGITWPQVRSVLTHLIVPSSASTPRLSDFTTNAALDLPYSHSFQKTLNEAGHLARLMGSQTIQSEHVLLALFEYKEVN
jgi:Clp amino terminal domain, pathogenicity island component